MKILHPDWQCPACQSLLKFEPVTNKFRVCCDNPRCPSFTATNGEIDTTPAAAAMTLKEKMNNQPDWI